MKIIASLYILLWGSLLIVALSVALFAASGRVWGLIGVALFGWLLWGNVSTLLTRDKDRQ